MVALQEPTVVIEENQEKNLSLLSMLAYTKVKMKNILEKTRKIGEDDPRRIIHSMKVGLALTLVSLFYYFRPLYDGFGQAGMWAVLTVVVVFEFTVGGTLSKCLNRGCATLIAGALGVGAEYLANLCGKEGEPIVLGILVFVLAATSTFMRFFPHVKRRYDYGAVIFILTFTLVAVSGYRVSLILQLAHQRMSTILIGGATCMIISILCYPVWAGQDLHNMAAANIENLATFLLGFGGEFFNFPNDETSKTGCKDSDKAFLHSYKSVLNSKAAEESLANFAWWEPAHGRFRFRHPWKHYLKICVFARECACQIETLSGLLKSKPQVSSAFQLNIQTTATKLSTESGKAFKELSHALKNMIFPSSDVEKYIKSSKAAADELKNILENMSLPVKPDLLEILPVLVTISVLVEIIKCIEKVSESVHELAERARFKKEKSSGAIEKHHCSGVVKPVDDIADSGDHVVIEIHSLPSGDAPKSKIAVKF